MKAIFIVSVILMLFGCRSNHDPLLDEAINIIETNSIMRDSINWTDFKSAIFKQEEKVKSKEDRYRIIQIALKSLNDRHSFFIQPDPDTNETSSADSNIRCEYKLLNQKVGYINIPSCQGDCTVVNMYVRQINLALEKLDKNQLSGWIIDLRTNGGGNMWPMVLGLGPLIGEGIFGYFVNPDNTYTPWLFHNGVVFQGKDTMMYQARGLKLNNRDKKIAVLINETTASAGEAVAISFIGKDKTRLFGCSTRGVSTANKGFPLSDGSCIVLTVSKMADRTKKIFGATIAPDEVSSQCHGERLIEIASQWISN